MAAGTGRDGRRRRVLNDGARSAAAAANNAAAAPDGDPPRKRRFAPEEGSVSFAVARGLLPSRGGSLSLVILLGLIATAGVVAGDLYGGLAAPLWRPLLDLQSPTSIGRWLVASLLLLSGGLSLVVFGLRSNRTDDVRGLYRWWFAAALASLATGALFSTQAHVAIAAHLSQTTGMAPLGGAVWWLAPGLAAVLLLVVRPMADLKESKLALFFMVIAAVSVVASAVATVGLLPKMGAQFAPQTSLGGLLLALVCGGAAQLLYVRRVLLETDGLIAAPERKPRVQRQPKETRQADPKPAATADEPAATKTNHAETATEPSSSSSQPPQPALWTDGSDGADGEFADDAPRRKLTKAERKRLRKQKSGRYAA